MSIRQFFQILQFFFKVWKRKWFILRRKSWQGNPRLEYHKSEESCMTKQNKTVVDLSNVVKIEECKSKSRHVSFKLIFNDTFMFLSTDNESSMNEWVKMIKKLVLPGPSKMSLVKTEAGKLFEIFVFLYVVIPFNDLLKKLIDINFD